MSRLTLLEAAAASGLSYRQVYRRVVQHQVCPSERDGAAYTIAADDVRLLVPRPPAKDPRPGVTLRPSVEQARVWQRAAGRRTVSSWLLKLANAASGWEQQAAGATPERHRKRCPRCSRHCDIEPHNIPSPPFDLCVEDAATPRTFRPREPAHRRAKP